MSDDSLTIPVDDYLPTKYEKPPRRLSRLVLPIAILIFVLGVGGYFYFSNSYGGSGGLTPILIKVEKGSFTHEVTNRGNVVSATNIEVTCEVRSKSGGGIEIIEIVENGITIAEGDVLVRLNSEQLKADKEREQIECYTSEASLIQAKSALSAAQSNHEEYINGQYVLDLLAIENQIAIAKENYRRAKEYYEYSRQLAAKGYITEAQLEADQFAMEKASNELKAAEKRREVLETYTRKQKLDQLQADIATAEAKLKAQESSHRMQTEQMTRIIEQVANCEITAPCDGQVVYANRPGSHGRSAINIEEGAEVREGQVIIRIQPTTVSDMQVTVRINESHIDRIRKGLPVRIALDAYRDLRLHGTVETVSPSPLPAPWYNSLAAREYETVVKIDDADGRLRSGLTAEVKIVVEELADVVRIPVQSVFGHGNKYYCVMVVDGRLVKREVKIGSSNEKYVVIREGLQPDEMIAEHANAFRDRLDLPPLTDTPPQRGGPRKPESRPPGAGGGRPSHATSGSGGSRGMTSGSSGTPRR